MEQSVGKTPITALEATAMIALGLFRVCNSGGNVIEEWSKT